jgi:hypothetical protein
MADLPHYKGGEYEVLGVMQPRFAFLADPG